MARNRCATAGVSAGRWLMQRQVHWEPIRRLSQGALPNAKSLYRDLLRTVREFPAEPMLDLNASGSEQSFAVIASLNIRYVHPPDGTSLLPRDAQVVNNWFPLHAYECKQKLPTFGELCRCIADRLISTT